MKRERDLITRRHPEWREHQLRWRWLLDSLEGGDRYRWAVYGSDRRGYPIRNLVRHKREYAEPGVERDVVLPSPALARAAAALSGYGGPAADASDDEYTLRLVRTPVPDYLAEVVRKYLARIYRREVVRDGPKSYQEWWEDVDGAGTPLDLWARRRLAPLLLALGCVDVIADHPLVPPDESVTTQADVMRLNLKAVEVAVIFPWDLVWWRLDRQGKYSEALVVERVEEGEDGDTSERFRHWTTESSTLYDVRGEVVEVRPHPYKRVPIERLFLDRKQRCPQIGASPLECVAEMQREAYNRDSELILSDVLQAHPLLQGPEDAIGADGSIAIGPGWMLPKKKTQTGTSTTYEGFDFVSPDKGPSDSIRQNLFLIRQNVERTSGLLKPAGDDAGTIAQSGISKSLDYSVLNDVLGEIADALQAAETRLAKLVVTVAADGQPSPSDLDSISVSYSRQFDLRGVDDIAAGLASIQDVLESSGRIPIAESRLIYSAVLDLMPGLTDQEYEEIRLDIENAVNGRSLDMKERTPTDGDGQSTPNPFDANVNGDITDEYDDTLEPES